MNLSVFFDRVRARPFGGSLSASQVSGIEAILDAAAKYGVTDQRHVAYALATAFHETARTMQPIKEYGGTAYFTKMYDIKGERPSLAKSMGNTAPGDGPKYCGRGYVQLTWKSNYARASKALGGDFVATPDLALQPDIAAAIMFKGMTEGWFTGKKLSDYFSASKDDPKGARRIINGTDKAATIAGYHADFLAALKAAATTKVMPSPSFEEAAPVTEPPLPTPTSAEDAQVPPPPAAEPAVSFWASIIAKVFK